MVGRLALPCEILAAVSNGVGVAGVSRPSHTDLVQRTVPTRCELRDQRDLSGWYYIGSGRVARVPLAITEQRLTVAEIHQALLRTPPRAYEPIVIEVAPPHAPPTSTKYVCSCGAPISPGLDVPTNHCPVPEVYSVERSGGDFRLRCG